MCAPLLARRFDRPSRVSPSSVKVTGAVNSPGSVQWQERDFESREPHPARQQRSGERAVWQGRSAHQPRHVLRDEQAATGTHLGGFSARHESQRAPNRLCGASRSRCADPREHGSSHCGPAAMTFTGCIAAP
jgi:hypothetical protein